MGVSATDSRRSLGELLRDLGEGSAALLRRETKLARLELQETFKTVGRGTAFVATGAVLALLGGLALLTGVIMLAGDQWLSDQFWLAALIVAVLTAAIAAWFSKKGLNLLSPNRLAPDETVETLKEDKEWLKRQLTSGATSR